ncbi:MAG TPA: pyridoxal phosphate-dependent aminotransferase, partial [Terriglobales bacterium]
MFASRTSWQLKRNRYSEELDRLRRSGARLLDLTASNPTTCGFHFDDDAILGSLTNPEALVYHPEPRGLFTAREAVSEYYREHARSMGSTASISPEQIFLTTGTSEAYSFLFRLLCNPGEQILAPRPSYPLFDFLAEIQDVKLVAYPLHYDHGWQVDMAALRSAITDRARAVMVVHPNNPTGSFIGSDEAAELAAICAENNLAIISDEVFLDYSLSAKVPHSFVLNTPCLTFTLSGLSKIACLPQMKVGWIVINGPEELRRQAEERLEVIADTYLSMNAPLQLAAPVLLRQRKAIQEQVRRRAEKNLKTLEGKLREQKLISRLEAQGGWYAVLRVPVTRSEEELAIALMRE